MIALAALALSPDSTAAPPPSQMAIQAFREACIQGSLKLSPERGKVLQGKDLDEFIVFYGWDRTPERSTVIKLLQSPNSYIILDEFRKPQSRSIAKSCALVSRSISQREAMAAFLEGLPDKDVPPGWIPNMYISTWTADHPEQGYRKRLSFGSHKSIRVELGLYPSAAAQISEGTKKQ